MIKAFFTNLGLIALGIILFSLSFPNVLVEKGIAIFAWVAYAPIFFLITRVNLPASVFWGALYGYGAYSVFNYWLSVFHPVAGLVVNSIYLFYFAVLFPLLVLARRLFPRRGYLVQWLIWLGFEYIRTKGFLGYSYGVTGYSQWTLLPVIQIAGLGGVWLVSALVMFPSAFIGNTFSPRSKRSNTEGKEQKLCETPCLSVVKLEKWPALIWLAALAAALVYGFASPVNYGDAPRAKLALIQQNNDPWIYFGPSTYTDNLRVLRRLSDEALAAHPDVDMVVWSETAFVPRIYWHLTYRDEPEFTPIVKELMDYLGRQSVPFLIGNDDGRKERNESGYPVQVDYNAVMLYEKAENTQIYRKLHLVPFTEHFPYEKQLPFLYQFLEKRDDIHWWKAGTEATVFTEGKLKFSTPICFEDTFGYLSRDFVRNGAELLVNLSNDAWSKSLPAQNQHLAMAVFRAVENRRSMVRSTASGQTCAIDPNGRILALAPPFTEAWLYAEVPIVTAGTLYTAAGDWAGVLFTALAIALLLFGIIRGILVKAKKGHIT
jgi:apolipoprotein N-acyltransferase